MYYTDNLQKKSKLLHLELLRYYQAGNLENFGYFVFWVIEFQEHHQISIQLHFAIPLDRTGSVEINAESPSDEAEKRKRADGRPPRASLAANARAASAGRPNLGGTYRPDRPRRVGGIKWTIYSYRFCQSFTTCYYLKNFHKSVKILKNLKDIPWNSDEITSTSVRKSKKFP